MYVLVSSLCQSRSAGSPAASETVHVCSTVYCPVFHNPVPYIALLVHFYASYFLSISMPFYQFVLFLKINFFFLSKQFFLFLDYFLIPFMNTWRVLNVGVMSDQCLWRRHYIHQHYLSVSCFAWWRSWNFTRLYATFLPLYIIYHFDLFAKASCHTLVFIIIFLSFNDRNYRLRLW